jgi:Tol biopolymer transport system component
MKLTNKFVSKCLKWSTPFWGAIIILFGCQSPINNSSYQSIVEGTGDYEHATWSPDGKQIMYQTEFRGPILIQDINSGNEEQLSLTTKDIYDNSSLVWISGSEIAFTPAPSASGELVIFDYISNTKKVFQLGTSIFNLCWSESEELFVLVIELPPSSIPSVYGNTVMKFDPESEEFEPLYRARDGHFVTDISCRLDGKQVAVIDREGDTAKGYTTRLKVITTSYLSEQTILESSSEMRFDEPTWSPDGKWIAVRSLQGQVGSSMFGIKLIATDGSEIRTIMEPSLSFSPFELAWSPIENQLLVRARSGLGKQSLYIIDLTPWLDSESIND